MGYNPTSGGGPEFSKDVPTRGDVAIAFSRPIPVHRVAQINERGILDEFDCRVRLRGSV